MRTILTIGHYSWVLAPGAKAELILKALGEALPVRQAYLSAERREALGVTDFYAYRVEGSVKMEMAVVPDCVILRARPGADPNDDSALERVAVVTPNPYRRKRLGAGQKQLPWSGEPPVA